MKIYLRVSVVYIFFAASLFGASRQRETRSQTLLAREISYYIKKSKTPRTTKAIEIYSRRNRKDIFQTESQLLLHPASNLKIETTSFALQSLGSEYKFTTRFLFSGIRVADTLDGNLIVRASGDPIVMDADLDSAANTISHSGIERINGDIIIDVSKFDSLQWGTGWMWDDEPAITRCSSVRHASTIMPLPSKCRWTRSTTCFL